MLRILKSGISSPTLYTYGKAWSAIHVSGGKFCVGWGERQGGIIDPGATYIFTYFTRYLKAHFQTQLKSTLQRSIHTPYKEDNCLFHDDIPLTTPSRRGSNDVRTCTLGDRGNIIAVMDTSMMMLWWWWMMMRWKVTTMMMAMIRRIPA